MKLVVARKSSDGDEILAVVLERILEVREA